MAPDAAPADAVEPYWRHWYEIVDEESLRQGDLFRDETSLWLPNDVEPPPRSETAISRDLSFGTGTWIVLTPSCNLDQQRTTGVLLAQVHAVSAESLKAPEGPELEKRKEVIRQGRMPGFFMLPPCADVEPAFPLSVAYFRTQVFHPIPYVLRWCRGPRLRLRHPVREAFGNWVGSQFADVGPEDHVGIPRFARVHDHHVLLAEEDQE